MPSGHFTTRTDIVEEDASDLHGRQGHGCCSSNAASSSSPGAVYRRNPRHQHNGFHIERPPRGGGGGGLGLQALFTEPRGHLGSTWLYVGDGRGAYSQVEEFYPVGAGRGSWVREEVTEYRDWRPRAPCILVGLVLFLLPVTFAGFLAINAYRGSQSHADAVEVQTTLKSPARAGDREIHVASEDGFREGDEIVIADSESFSEARRIISFGSIILDSSLERPFPIGSAVIKARTDPVVVLGEASQAGDSDLKVSSFGSLHAGATVLIGGSENRKILKLKWLHRLVVDSGLDQAYPVGTPVVEATPSVHYGCELGWEEREKIDKLTGSAGGRRRWKQETAEDYRLANWSDNHRAFCCRRYGLACDDGLGSTPSNTSSTSSTTSNASSASSTATTTTEEEVVATTSTAFLTSTASNGTAMLGFGAPRGFDCGKGRADWEMGWTPAKLAWCCGQDRNFSSCPLMGTSAPFDCSAGLSNWERGWSTFKQEWCCRNEAVACSYGCTDPEDAKLPWTAAKRDWCCRHWGRGCEPAKPETTTNCDAKLDFGDVVYSNLGEKGPDFARDPNIRYRAVCEVDGEPVDLLVRTVGEYQPALPKHNGHNGIVGRINLKYGTSVDLDFAFVRSDRDSPVRVPRVLFTVLDIDRGDEAGGAESVLIRGFSLFYLDNDTSVHYQPVGPSGARFSSTGMGDLTDNPSNMSNLTEQQRRKAVTLLFTNKSSFSMSFEASGQESIRGRVFMFGGKRDLSASHATSIGGSATPQLDAGAGRDQGQGGLKPGQDEEQDQRQQEPQQQDLQQQGPRLTCRLDCSVEGAARPVRLHAGRAGDSFVPVESAVGGLDMSKCADACSDTAGCDGIVYGNGTCYGVWEVRTSECKRGDIGDYRTQFLRGRPWGRCVLVSSPHVVTFDRMYGPAVSECEPADYHLVRSDHLAVQARLDRTAASSEASSIVGIAVTGTLVSGHTLVVEYLGPGLGRHGFRVSWDGRQILEEYPSSFRSSDGLLSARHWRGDPAWRQWQARGLLGNRSESLPSYFFQFPPYLAIHVLLGVDSCGVILAMQKLEVGQAGLCGNFNCDQVDDAYELLQDGGRVEPMPAGESLFSTPHPSVGPEAAAGRHRREEELWKAVEACSSGLRDEARAVCEEASPSEAVDGCVAEACASGSSGLAEMRAAVGRLEPGLLAPR